MARIAGVGVGDRNPVRIMGILNASPESFYKKSVRTGRARIRDHVREMEAGGADFIDVGGMSTAPYLKTIVPERTEAKRILDAVSIIQDSTNIPISVDTCRAEPARLAMEHGVEIINDISGLKYDDMMRDIVSEYAPSLILCAFAQKTVTGDPTSTKRLLGESLRIARRCGIPSQRMAVDPSIGFFRREGRGPFFTRIRSDWTRRDLGIIRNLKSIKGRYPALVSVSNKSFLGEILQKRPPDRLIGSVAAEAAAVIYGADIVRTHDVDATRDAITVASRLRSHKGL